MHLDQTDEECFKILMSIFSEYYELCQTNANNLDILPILKRHLSENLDKFDRIVFTSDYLGCSMLNAALGDFFEDIIAVTQSLFFTVLMFYETKSVEEIRNIFHLTDDLTPEQRKEISIVTKYILNYNQ